jgi:peroxiredoxin Q/BCP
MTFKNHISRIALAGLLISLTAVTAAAQQASLKVGDKAPDFQGITEKQSVWKSGDHVGKQILVVYFYPAAMSEGCTKQACMFRDDHSKLNALGAEVIGVSGDRVANLRAFKGAHKLNFPLLSDTAGVIARAFGVPTRQGGTLTRTVNGKEIILKRDLTAARWTFVIDRNGQIAFKETEVDPEGDSKAVMAAIQRMTLR